MKETTSYGSSIVAKITDNLAASIVIAGSVALAVAVGVAAGPAQVINSVVTGGMWALLAVGLALVFGVMNVPHFAHGESFMIGAYAAYFVFTPIHSSLKDNPDGFLVAIGPFIGFLAAAWAGRGRDSRTARILPSAAEDQIRVGDERLFTDGGHVVRSD